MFQDSFLPPAVGTSPRCSRTWSNAGMAWSGGSSTADISESPNVAAACSLSSVLEPPTDVPTRFYLSPRAARGVLKRALKRGRTLPSHLEAALRAVASMNQAEAAKTTAILSQLASMPTSVVSYELLPLLEASTEAAAASNTNCLLYTS